MESKDAAKTLTNDWTLGGSVSDFEASTFRMKGCCFIVPSVRPAQLKHVKLHPVCPPREDSVAHVAGREDL
jgi:hypothetical protein